jgi:Flp pilus assembly protein TadB
MSRLVLYSLALGCIAAAVLNLVLGHSAGVSLALVAVGAGAFVWTRASRRRD